ncbi:MAG TPA: Wadjet anti-phage system protein JetD domain-containing protein [Tissierellaceae bacterium]|nr:Wadjet anti-phage system protein JetD domain-containing protein [Tissierellaceae bacterium]
MDKKINKFIDQVKQKNRKRFLLGDLETYIINSYKGSSMYIESGGYKELAECINKSEEKGLIKPINASDYNGLNPPLKLRWEIVLEEEKSNWNRSKMMQLSDYLDFTYYLNNPRYQTQLEWEYIENIYGFLKSRDIRKWASVEERSLELFYDEKYLTNRKETLKGRYGILRRLKISYEDLKMKKYGEMFIYWNRGTRDIKRVIILENHSTFFSYKRLAENENQVFGFKPDILIYGGGNKIENSFSFIEEIADISKIQVLYFGDIDSEGFGIYYRLKERYKDINISLQKEAYKHLINIVNREYKKTSKRKNQLYLDYFLEEVGDYLGINSIRKLKEIWHKDLRIPQELIDYEYLLKVSE